MKNKQKIDSLSAPFAQEEISCYKPNNRAWWTVTLFFGIMGALALACFFI